LVAAGDAKGVAERLAEITQNAQRIQGGETKKVARVKDAVDAVSEQPVS
jgi:hypothetical protein